MATAVTSRLPEIISTLKVLKNVIALAPLGEHVGAGIELAISICEMAQVRELVFSSVMRYVMHHRHIERGSQQGSIRGTRASNRCTLGRHFERRSEGC
jgi:hypothetical protein